MNGNVFVIDKGRKENREKRSNYRKKKILLMLLRCKINDEIKLRQQLGYRNNCQNQGKSE